jgi:hypothetical protein
LYLGFAGFEDGGAVVLCAALGGFAVDAQEHLQFGAGLLRAAPAGFLVLAVPALLAFQVGLGELQVVGAGGVLESVGFAVSCRLQLSQQPVVLLETS